MESDVAKNFSGVLEIIAAEIDELKSVPERSQPRWHAERADDPTRLGLLADLPLSGEVKTGLLRVRLDTPVGLFLIRVQLIGELVADRKLDPARFHIGVFLTPRRIGFPRSHAARLFRALIAIRHVLVCLLQHDRPHQQFCQLPPPAITVSEADKGVCLLTDSKTRIAGCGAAFRRNSHGRASVPT